LSHHKANFRKRAKEPIPYVSKDLLLVVFYRLYTFLYIVDESTFSASEETWWLHKKGEFYASPSFTNAPVRNIRLARFFWLTFFYMVLL
jgi:hypothetical protein